MKFLRDFWFFRKKTEPRSHQLSGEQEMESHLKEMVEGIENLRTTLVKEVFVPRPDAVFISLAMTSEEMLHVIQDAEHSRYPVYDKDIDYIIGVLYTKDLIQHFVHHKTFDNLASSLKSLVRQPFIVPESKSIYSLLKEFLAKRVHIALCVDEYGGISGLVCLEDILEKIVGDIQDEFDEEPEDIVALDKSTYLCSTRVSISEFNAVLKTKLPDDNYDTLGGFVLYLFEHVPVQYEKVRYQDLLFIVQEVDKHKIKSVKVVKQQNVEDQREGRA